MKISIAGTGYVGIVTAVCLAEYGHEVTCVDIDKEKINMLKNGKAPIFEPELENMMLRNQKRLYYTSDYRAAYKEAEVIFIGVGTPERRDGSANLSYVYAVAGQIAESVEQDCVVVVKSTVPIGTNDKLEKRMKDSLKKNVKLYIASNPEFLSQGTAIRDTLNASRIIIGVEDKEAEEVLLKVYEKFNVPKLVMDRRSAEMVKYASNDFLALKISYVNEIANLCEEIGADISAVTKGMGYDERIGNKFLDAGVGYGGSCFPKDTKALHWLSNMHDKELKTIKAAIEVNEQQKLRLIKKARKYYETFEGLTVAVLGLTFKPNTDDLREAPSLVNIPIFLEEGAEVKAWDPIGIESYKKIYPTEITYCDTIDGAIINADICFIFTEWEQLKIYDTRNFERLMRHAVVLDGRGCFVTEPKGICYEKIGMRYKERD